MTANPVHGSSTGALLVARACSMLSWVASS
jgi:hypothetical protein